MARGSRITRRKAHRKIKRTRKHRGGAEAGWYRKVSRTTGKDYWVNKQTGVSSWTIPGEIKHCDGPSLTKEDADYCVSNPSAVANVGAGERNIKYRLRKARAKNKAGCTLKYKVNSSGEGEMVPECDEDSASASGNGTSTGANGPVEPPSTPRAISA